MPQTHLVLYDDECPLCTFQMKLLTWLDWREALSLVPLSSPRVQELGLPLSREDLSAAIHCVSRGGYIYRGARAIRFLSLRLPLLVPLWFILWIPGVITLAELVYTWVSSNRQLLSRVFGCKDACGILPARARRQDEFR